MKISPLISPDEFVGLDGVVHLCTGGEAPWLKAQEGVYAEFARWKSAGHAGRGEIYERGERCRSRMGQLWGVPPEWTETESIFWRSQTGDLVWAFRLAGMSGVIVP